MGFATDCVYAGQEPDPSTGAIVTPIFQTSTYVQQGIGQHKGYEYARTQNPTRRALEKNLAALERGTDAYCFASRIVSTRRSWPTTAWSSRSWTRATPAPSTRRRASSRCSGSRPRPTPLMKICDVAALAQAAHRRRALLVVDNTFMSPFFQRPLELGADIVVHSTTKFLNGHSDSVGGVAVVKDKGHAQWLQYYQNAAGAILSPFDSWLVLRGTKTLAVRMPRHEENGRRVATFLREQKKVKKVYWPGFTDHPGHETHKRQSSGFGALITFDLGTREAADRLLRGVKLCSLGESLGGVETLISHPATMTHAGYTQAERDALGIGNGLVRISVGIEDAEDLIADLTRGLDAV